MIYAGIDIGSTTTKTVILRKNGTGDIGIVAESIADTGFDHHQIARNSFEQALAQANLKDQDVTTVVSTGYGRKNVSFATKQVTEIMCHGRGANFLFPSAHFVIDIGGQDSKVILLGKGGKAVDFAMNEKCAAGTGRFIEVMARVLQVNLDQMGELSSKKQKDIRISSMCTVFAESEIIGKIAQGCHREDIIYGLHVAIADRIVPMIKRIGMQKDVILTGGVARNKGIVDVFSEKLQTKISVPAKPQLVGALGAALYGIEEESQ